MNSQGSSPPSGFRAGGFSIELAKKKRGRPRKYSPDGNITVKAGELQPFQLHNHRPMDDVVIFGGMDDDLENTVRRLRHNNVGVVIRNEYELNCLRIREREKKRSDALANAKFKGKQKSTSSTQGTKNKDCQLKENNRFDALANAKFKGKHKSTSSSQGTTNKDCQLDWSEFVNENNRVYRMDLCAWGRRNQVVVHSPHWAKCVRIDTRTLRILMKRRFKGMKKTFKRVK